MTTLIPIGAFAPTIEPVSEETFECFWQDLQLAFYPYAMSGVEFNNEIVVANFFSYMKENYPTIKDDFVFNNSALNLRYQAFIPTLKLKKKIFHNLWKYYSYEFSELLKKIKIILFG